MISISHLLFTPTSSHGAHNPDLFQFFLVFTLSSLVSILTAYSVDKKALHRGYISIGLLIICMYIVTYGLGLSLWRLNPDSLYGYATQSTIGSLRRLMHLFSIGILGISFGYLLGSQLFKLNFLSKPFQSSLFDLAKYNQKELTKVGVFILIISAISICTMLYLGVFSRTPELQSQVVQSSIFAKLLIGLGVLSRLAPISFILLPLYFNNLKPTAKIAIISLLVIWFAAAVLSQSRSLLISLPTYYLIGLVVWNKISRRRLLLTLLISSLFALPSFELIRVSREGDTSNPELLKTFQIFQIGKQLMGTSHEFYLMLNPNDCRIDLQEQILSEPLAREIYRKGASNYPPDSYERWHIVARYASCAERSVSKRGLSDLQNIPLGLLPSSIFRKSPSLFDGQHLSQQISSQLDLKPGEISYSTLSFFADSWWRLRESGVLIFSFLLGLVFSMFQGFTIYLLQRYPVTGMFAQLLMLTLIGSWINNTLLTMSWHLFWELPRTLFELIILTSLSKRIRLNNHSPKLS